MLIPGGMHHWSNRIATGPRSTVPAILFLLLLALIFSRQPNWGVPPLLRFGMMHAIPPDRSFIGAIESRLVTQAGTHLFVSGWAASASPALRVVRVELYVDRALVARVTDFVVRSDVAAAYGRSDFEWSGWHSILSTKELKSGDYELTLRCIGSDGSSEIVVSRKFSIVE
jgi:hypothetical protein